MNTCNEFIQECKNSGKFTSHEIEQICYGFENGLPIEQVKLYAKPKFTAGQMEEIRIGLEEGLSIEQVKIYS